jgi:cation diffusion facilitator CzcD-associated flavoprotein CzcO
MTEMRTETVVIRASAAGLATSACLTRAKAEHVLLEQSEQVGTAWRNHYDRLHLHTHKGGSALPHLPFAPELPRYPSRMQFVEYLEGYVEKLGLRPKLGEPVTKVAAGEDGWVVETSKARYRSRNVVVATGLTRSPHLPSWPGQEQYRGELMHSSLYRNGEKWRGRRVLVIGFGNSAGEIALDLLEHGVAPTLSVRGPVNVISREVLGLPVLAVGLLLRPFPPRVADLIGAPLFRLVVGNVKRLGLTKLPYGAMQQVQEHGQFPFIDIGTIAAIREGRIALRRGVERFTPDGVRFDGGTEEAFDAVIAATGYRPRLGDFLGDAASICGAGEVPPRSGVAVSPGLYFCGFHPSTRGMLRQIGIDAQSIARAIDKARA